MSQTLDQLEPAVARPSPVEPGFDDFGYKPIPPLAPVSVLLGVCSLSGLLTPLGLIFAVFGTAFGAIARRQIQRAEGDLGGRKLANLGLVLSAGLLVTGASLHAYWYQTEVPDGYQRISFGADISKKGFIIEEGRGRVHPDVAALEGKPLFVKGYMYPEGQIDGITTFILCRDNGQCCFGGQPKLTDMIKVKLTNGVTAKYDPNLVAVAGVFRLRHSEPVGSLDPVFELEATHFSLAKTSY